LSQSRESDCPLSQPIPGTTKQWNWCRSWADEWQSSLKTPGKQLICYSDCQWIFYGEMRSPSTALTTATQPEAV